MKNSRFLFVTGGVLSALGKGVAAASIGRLLESFGLNINIMKLDPYLNVDPGTMSPYQHGEVFVTVDGAETDLDLGHYERFTSITTKRENNWTAGRIYHDVLERERQGEYLGKTVQVVPHITDKIKSIIYENADHCDVLIVEIGGTVGDIESLPFLEAIRQIGLEEENRVQYMHLTLVPYIKTAGELKTKPTQHSVRALREIGIQADYLICRADYDLPDEIKKKIALFSNVKVSKVISARDADSIYEIPLLFDAQGLGDKLLNDLGLSGTKKDISLWQNWVESCKEPEYTVQIGLIGKYTSLGDSYKSLSEAFTHAAGSLSCRVNLIMVDAEEISDFNVSEKLGQFDGIMVPGGFGIRGIEGMIQAVRYSRIEKIPFFGICLGMQMASLEFLRHVAGLEKAHSLEFVNETLHPAFLKLKELTGIDRMGSTMRLGSFSCTLRKGSLAYQSYGQEMITERHRHRYEFNPEYEHLLGENGMVVSGKNPERNLVEIIELNDHPWFLGCQYHPEFQSRPLAPHPLFVSFISAALDRVRN